MCMFTNGCSVILHGDERGNWYHGEFTRSAFFCCLGYSSDFTLNSQQWKRRAQQNLTKQLARGTFSLTASRAQGNASFFWESQYFLTSAIYGHVFQLLVCGQDEFVSQIIYFSNQYNSPTLRTGRMAVAIHSPVLSSHRVFLLGMWMRRQHASAVSQWVPAGRQGSPPTQATDATPALLLT